MPSWLERTQQLLPYDGEAYVSLAPQLTLEDRDDEELEELEVLEVLEDREGLDELDDDDDPPRTSLRADESLPAHAVRGIHANAKSNSHVQEPRRRTASIVNVSVTGNGASE